jgi:hypothetical protein
MVRDRESTSRYLYRDAQANVCLSVFLSGQRRGRPLH